MRSFISLLAVAKAVLAWTDLHHTPFMNKNIDAIVVPGTYTSHMPTFFGSDAITHVLPTSAELQDGCYSGENPNDLSVYWIPTLYHVDGEAMTEVPIFRFSTYYNNAFSEVAIPQDFAMISGNASAQTQAEASHAYNGLEWFCEGSTERESDIAKFPTASCDKHLQVSLRFPNCVNPSNIAEHDWSDASNQCPAGMKQIPQIRYAVRYDTNKVAPNGWVGDAPFQLSCGSAPGNGYCFHGDFINGWFEDAAENMLIKGGGGYDDIQFIGGQHGDSLVADSCVPTDQDPENGTDDYWTSVEMMKGGAAVPEAPIANVTGNTTTGADSTVTFIVVPTLTAFTSSFITSVLPRTSPAPVESIGTDSKHAPYKDHNPKFYSCGVIFRIRCRRKYAVSTNKDDRVANDNGSAQTYPGQQPGLHPPYDRPRNMQQPLCDTCLLLS